MGGLLWASESDLASRHGVTQLGLVVDEGHDAQVGLDEQGLLQDQHTVGTTRDGLLFMGLLYSLHQLGPEVVQLQGSTTTRTIRPRSRPTAALSSNKVTNIQSDAATFTLGFWTISSYSSKIDTSSVQGLPVFKEADCRLGFKEMTPGRERPPSHRRGPWGVLWRWRRARRWTRGSSGSETRPWDACPTGCECRNLLSCKRRPALFIFFNPSVSYMSEMNTHMLF